MARLLSMACPSCAAPLTISGPEVEITCPFCGNMIAVPADLRQPPPAPTPYQPAARPDYASDIAALRAARSARPRSGFGLIAFALIFMLVAGIAALGASVVLPGITSPVVASFGGEGTGAGLFSDPIGLAIDGKDNIYVSDRKTGRIQRFDSSGHYLSYWQGASLPFTPCLAADQAGNVYVCSDKTVQKFNGLTAEKMPGDFNPGALNYFDRRPDALTVLLDGSVMACSCGAGTPDSITKFNPSGQIVAQYDKAIGPHLDGALDDNAFMAADGLGNLYVLIVWGTDGYVFIFKPDGTFVNRFGSQGMAVDQFYFPGAIAVDSLSNIYVSDVHAIKVFDKSGRFLRSIAFPAGNRGAKAMAFNSAGALYVLAVDKKVYKLAVAPAK